MITLFLILITGLQETALHFKVTASQNQVCLGTEEIIIERCAVNRSCKPVVIDKDGIKSWSFSRRVYNGGVSGGVSTSTSHSKPAPITLSPNEQYCFEPVRLKLKDDFRFIADYTVGYTLYGEHATLNSVCTFSIVDCELSGKYPLRLILYAPKKVAYGKSLLLKARFQNISKTSVFLDKKAIWNYLKITSGNSAVELSEFQAAESEADLVLVAPGGSYEESREVVLDRPPGSYRIELEYFQLQKLKVAGSFPVGRVKAKPCRFRIVAD